MYFGASILQEDHENDALAQYALSGPILGSPSDMRPRTAENKKRRKLNLIKCDRCRLDKKDCTPIQRTWPAKCDRCAKSDFPCSEGKRAERKSKHAALLSKPLVLGNSIQSNNNRTEFNFDDWAFQSSYLKIIGMALIQLRTLCMEYLMRHSFAATGYDKPPIDFFHNTPVHELVQFQRSSMKNLESSLSKSIHTGSSGNASLVLSIAMHNLVTSDHESQCCACISSCAEDHLSALAKRGDIGGEFLARQQRYSKYYRHGCNQYLPTDFDARKDMSRLEELGQLMRGRLRHDAFSRSLQFLGVYYQPEVVEGLFIHRAQICEEMDCLGRMPIVQRIDIPDDDGFDGYEPSLYDLKKYLSTGKIDHQDILNRSLLHIACLKGWHNLVEELLQSCANQYLTTHTGQLPLHYATDVGDKDIGEMLLNHGDDDRLLVGFDCFGKSPLYYAVESRHAEFVRMLLAHANYGASEIQDAGCYSQKNISPPLIVAISKNNLDMVEILSEYGANFMVSWNGKTALSRIQDILEKMLPRYIAYPRWKAIYESACRQEEAQILFDLQTGSL